MLQMVRPARGIFTDWLGTLPLPEGQSPQERGRRVLEHLVEALLQVQRVLVDDAATDERGGRAHGWATRPQIGQPVLTGISGMVGHAYLARPEIKAEFLAALDRFPDRRWWLLDRMLLDRAQVLNAKAGVHDWAIAPDLGTLKPGIRPAGLDILGGLGSPGGLHKAGLAVRDLTFAKQAAGHPFFTIFAGASTAKLLEWAESQRVPTGNKGRVDTTGMRPHLPALIGLDDLFPSAWLDANASLWREGISDEMAALGVGGIPLTAFPATTLHHLLVSFLASPEATAPLDDPRVAPLGDFTWIDTPTIPAAQLDRVTRWQMGRLARGNPDGTCPRCGFPTWMDLDRVSLNDGWGHTKAMGASWIPSFDITPSTSGESGAQAGAVVAKGEKRAMCLACRVEKVLLEEGQIQAVGERLIKVWNLGDAPLPSALVGTYAQASAINGPHAFRASYQAHWPELIAPGECVVVGAEDDALAPLDRPGVRRRHMGRWGLLYQGLVLAGHRVAVGFASLNATVGGRVQPGLFGLDVPVSRERFAQEMARVLAVKCQMAVFERTKPGVISPNQARASVLYGAEAWRVTEALAAGLRTLFTSTKIPRHLRNRLVGSVCGLMARGKVKMSGIMLADEVAFWSGPGRQFLSDSSKLGTNVGATTIALREAFKAASMVPTVGLSDDEVVAARHQAAVGALVKRVNPYIRKERYPEVQPVLEEAARRVGRILALPYNHRTRVLNTIAECVRNTNRYKLDWQKLAQMPLEDHLGDMREVRQPKPTEPETPSEPHN